jgi:hypothetical protein
MPHHHQAPAHSPERPPTPRQQRYIRDLAVKRGRSFTPPKTFAEASKLIDELKGQRSDSISDRRREVKGVRADMMDNRGGSARVRDEEVDGYGSSATWRGGRS